MLVGRMDREVIYAGIPSHFCLLYVHYHYCGSFGTAVEKFEMGNFAIAIVTVHQGDRLCVGVYFV